MVSGKRNKEMAVEDISYNNTFRPLREPLGVLVMEFSLLEGRVTDIINVLLNIRYAEGAALDWMMQNFSIRIELFYFLSQQKFIEYDDVKNMSKEIFHRLREVNSDRNNLIHGQWNGYDTSEKTYSKVRLQAQDGKLIAIPIYNISVNLLVEEVEYVMKLRACLTECSPA